MASIKGRLVSVALAASFSWASVGCGTFDRFPAPGVVTTGQETMEGVRYDDLPSEWTEPTGESQDVLEASAGKPDRLAEIGGRLAAGVDQETAPDFSFETTNYFRPRIDHADGAIFVSIGLLDRLDDEGLAVALAIEMAESILESQRAEDDWEPMDLPSTGPGDLATERAMAARFAEKDAPSQAEIDGVALGILRQAGYQPEDIRETRGELAAHRAETRAKLAPPKPLRELFAN